MKKLKAFINFGDPGFLTAYLALLWAVSACPSLYREETGSADWCFLLGMACVILFWVFVSLMVDNMCLKDVEKASDRVIKYDGNLIASLQKENQAAYTVITLQEKELYELRKEREGSTPKST